MQAVVSAKKLIADKALVLIYHLNKLSDRENITDKYHTPFKILLLKIEANLT